MDGIVTFFVNHGITIFLGWCIYEAAMWCARERERITEHEERVKDTLVARNRQTGVGRVSDSFLARKALEDRERELIQTLAAAKAIDRLTAMFRGGYVPPENVTRTTVTIQHSVVTRTVTRRPARRRRNPPPYQAPLLCETEQPQAKPVVSYSQGSTRGGSVVKHLR